MFNHVRQGIAILRYHWIGLVIALLATVHVVSPVILGRISAGTSYQGIYYSDNGDWPLYVARVRRISEGHGAGNPFLAEHADDAYQNIPGAETVAAYIVRMLHIDPVDLQICLDIIAPFFITLLGYALLFRLSNHRFLSAFIFLFLILTNVWDLDKPIHPQFNLPLLLLFLFIWIGFLRQEDSRAVTAPKKKISQNWVSITICGILLGLLYFIYFYNWSFLYVVLVCSSLFAFWYRRWNIIIFNSLVILVSLPFALVYGLEIVRVTHAPLYAELAVRNGILYTHLPTSLPRLVVAVFACMVGYLFVRYARQPTSAVAQGMMSLLLSNVIYPNQHVVTGITLQIAEHWSWMPILIFSMVIAWMYPLFKRALFVSERGVLVAGAVFFCLFILATIRLSSFMLPMISKAKTAAFISIQRYGAVLHYLQRSTPPGSVILSDNAQLTYLIPAFTHDFVYYYKMIYFLSVGNQEIFERYILSNQFNPSFLKDGTLGISDPRSAILWGAVFHLEDVPIYRWLKIVPPDAYSWRDEQQLVKESLRRLASEGGVNIERLFKYRIDYIVWDRALHPDWTFEGHPELQRIFEAEQLVVYRTMR